MTRSEIVQAFADAGITIGGEDQGKNMGTMMWRLKDRFTNLEGFGYWPADVENESCGYTPELGEKSKETAEPRHSPGLGRNP